MKQIRLSLGWALLSTLAPMTSAFGVLPSRKRSGPTSTVLQAIDTVNACKDTLLTLVKQAPSGRATPAGMSAQILENVKLLEGKCPTPDSDILKKQAGSWELLWTAQDPSAPETKKNGWILNPIENQAYSINPEGRANPFLPMPLQNFLEKRGWVATQTRSTQAIDLQNSIIRNIVAFNIIGGRRASLTVFVKLEPDAASPRMVNVQFLKFSINLPDTPFQNMEFPLGIFGPSGWIKTVYIDNDLRVTRGHKGSVFVLTRPRRGSV